MERPAAGSRRSPDAGPRAGRRSAHPGRGHTAVDARVPVRRGGLLLRAARHPAGRAARLDPLPDPQVPVRARHAWLHRPATWGYGVGPRGPRDATTPRTRFGGPGRGRRLKGVEGLVW